MKFAEYVKNLEELYAELNTDYHAMLCHENHPFTVAYLEELMNEVELLQKKLQFVDEVLGE